MERGSSKFTPGFVVVALVAFASLLPFLYLLLRSMQPGVNHGPGGLWIQLFQQIPVGTFMINSAIVSAGATVLVLILSCAAGFGLAKLSFPGSGLLFLFFIALIAVPLGTTIITNFFNFARIGGVGASWGPIVLYAAIATPFSTVLMTSFFRGLPDELVEGPIVDGAMYWQILWSIMVPIARPALMTVGVLAFLGTWNDLLVALLFLPDPDMRTISVAVASLQGFRNANIELILTGSLLSAIPPIIAFILFQKYLVRGVTAGVVK